MMHDNLSRSTGASVPEEQAFSNFHTIDSTARNRSCLNAKEVREREDSALAELTFYLFIPLHIWTPSTVWLGIRHFRPERKSFPNAFCSVLTTSLPLLAASLQALTSAGACRGSDRPYYIYLLDILSE